MAANITFSEGSGVNNSIYGNSQSPVRMIIEKRGEAFEQESIVKQIFKMDKSEHWSEKYTGLTGMSGFQAVGENGAYPTDGQEEGYSTVLAAVTWKDSFSLSREMIEDTKSLDLRQKPMGFVTAYYRTREKFGAALIGGAIKGDASLSFASNHFSLKTADGQNLFYSAHPNKIAGDAQCNLFSDAFSSDALGMLEVKMQNTRGDNDEILDVAPDTILIPNQHALKKAVFAAVGADKDPETANNGFNYQFGRWNIIVWPYLNQFITSGTSPWVLLDSRYNKDYGSLIWLDRVALDVKSTVDDNTDANVWRGYARFTAGFHDWRGIACAGVSGATDLS
jgi:phage major head subunit gpT-like protein